MKTAPSIRICGIDEAGRGALAGPLVAAAVILPCTVKKISRRAKIKIRDGKLLNAKQRNKVYSVLKRVKALITIEVVSARQINNRGIQRANKEVIRRLIKSIDADRYIVDGRMKLGRIHGKSQRIHSIVDADATVAETILAGIVAKVERDRRMRELHREFPRYYWRSNKGYGTKRHKEAIALHGTCRYHRSIFVTTAMHRSS